MPFRSYRGFRPYVPVAQRRLQAQRAATKLSGKGRALSPVHVDGRTIAKTFWGQAWCRNLESYSDYANRLPRGRTYVRNGSVIDLQIAAGTIAALVQGSSLYTVTIKIAPLDSKRWSRFKERCAGRIASLLDLLQGRLSKEILADLTDHGHGLFPAPSEIALGCTCPDWADMCKHVAATLYGVGARLDRDPALFFTLRGVDMQELVTAASAAATADLAGAGPADTALADADLAEIFGVELDTSGETPSPVLAAEASPSAPNTRRAKVSSETPGKGSAKSRSARKGKKTPASSSKRRPAGKKKPKRGAQRSRSR